MMRDPILGDPPTRGELAWWAALTPLLAVLYLAGLVIRLLNRRDRHAA